MNKLKFNMSKSTSKILILVACFVIIFIVLKRTNLFKSTQSSSNNGSSDGTSSNRYSTMEIDNIAADLAKDSRCIPYNHYANWKKAASFNDEEWATFEQLFATYRKQGFQRVWRGMIKNKTGVGAPEWNSFRYGITKHIQ